jgi:[NiFe] hydrogenase diaphorase moiety large subunit
VSGDVARPGVYEFPLGVPISEVLDAAGAERAQAAIVGGAAGTCVPATEFSRTISYEDVSTGGAVIVIGEHRDLLDVVENLQAFFVNESCGQCTPCRIGNIRLLAGIRDLRQGQCGPERLDDLVALGQTMRMTSKCGLGQSSPNVFCSMVKHFRQDFLDRVSIPVS